MNLATQSSASSADEIRESGRAFQSLIVRGNLHQYLYQAIVFHLQQTEEQLTLQHTSITVSACICNLTQKNHHKRGTEISYEHSQDNIENLIENIQTLSNIFNTGTTTLRITSVPPTSLLRSRTRHFQTHRLRQHIHRQRHTIIAPTTPTRYPAHKHSHF